MELRKAAIKAETDAAQADAQASGPVAKAARDQEVIAAAVEIEGDADASAILARGEAEAAAMAKKATAYEQYGDAAVIDLLARILPEVVREASSPMGAIDKLTVVSTDGASTLTKTVAGNVTEGMQIASDLLGVDLQSLFGRLSGRAAGQVDSSTALDEVGTARDT